MKPAARLSGRDMGRSPQSASRRIVQRYLRAVEPVLRGPVVVPVAIAAFVVAGLVGGRPGIVVASAFMGFHGIYCLLNFWHCRETHCVVTGIGWTSLAMLGFAATLVPGEGPSWYGANIASAAYLVILGLGYSLEWVVAVRTGRRVLR